MCKTEVENKTIDEDELIGAINMLPDPELDFFDWAKIGKNFFRSLRDSPTQKLIALANGEGCETMDDWAIRFCQLDPRLNRSLVEILTGERNWRFKVQYGDWRPEHAKRR